MDQRRMHSLVFRYMPSITKRNSPLLPRLTVCSPPSRFSLTSLKQWSISFYYSQPTLFSRGNQRDTETPDVPYRIQMSL